MISFKNQFLKPLEIEVLEMHTSSEDCLSMDTFSPGHRMPALVLPHVCPWFLAAHLYAYEEERGSRERLHQQADPTVKRSRRRKQSLP